MSNSHIQTITLEILRPGPSHNQLISPLTTYLCLCENRGAVSLHLPMEHRELQRQRQVLSYRTERPLREAQLAQTAAEVGDKVLCAIPTLTAALAQTDYGENTLIHLRLILSAAELAMVPFELASAPQGYPAEGKPLLLQSIAPITVTREVRNATVSMECWSRPPRILVVAASPPGYEPVPLRAHMLALRRAIDNWVPTDKNGGPRDLLTVLPRASVHAIREACAGDDYTHVHILAHGTRYKEGGEEQFGVALFDTAGEKLDIVGGTRLANALRTHRRSGTGFSAPNVVSMATCDSGDVNSVVMPGASLAHNLHEAGVPWVVASQYPLSMVGSILMTELLYSGLLRGDDPRIVLHHLRQVLHAECYETHDWASLVAYAAVPHDFAEQVREARQQQSERAINVAFQRADEILEEHLRAHESGDAAAQADTHRRIRKVLGHLDEQLAVLHEAIPDGDGPQERQRRGAIYSRQGSLEKRRAFLLYQEQDRNLGAARKRGAAAVDPGEDGAWMEPLRRARKYYFAAAKLELNKHWPLTQHLSCFAILGEKVPQEYWTVARIAAELDTDSSDQETRAWGHASLAELYLLELLWNPRAVPGHAIEHAQDLWRLTGAGTFPVASTLRQLERYLGWGPASRNKKFADTVRKLAEALKRDV